MTSTKHYREDHPSFSRSNGAVRPQQESRQVHDVNYSNNVDDDDDDDDDALIMTSSSKPYKAQTRPSSSRALSTSGHSKKITQEIQDSNSDDEDDGGSDVPVEKNYVQEGKASKRYGHRNFKEG